jgi:TonB family protein
MKRSFIGAIVLWCLVAVATAGAQVKTVVTPPQDYVPNDTAPEAIKQVQPKYPAAASKDSIEGTVWLKVWIDEMGSVAELIVQKSDNEILNHSAIAAAKQWTFKPALMKGKPVAVWVSIPFRFKLQENDKTRNAPTPSVVKAKRYPPAEDVRRDIEPELVSQVQPQYPNEAFQARLEGTVYTKMWIDETGHVIEVIVTKSDNEVFNQVSMDTGLQWVFKPALANGKPIAVWVTVPFRFKISSY